MIVEPEPGSKAPPPARWPSDPGQLFHEWLTANWWATSCAMTRSTIRVRLV